MKCDSFDCETIKSGEFFVLPDPIRIPKECDIVIKSNEMEKDHGQTNEQTCWKEWKQIFNAENPHKKDQLSNRQRGKFQDSTN